jgi:hypothetical protein
MMFLEVTLNTIPCEEFLVRDPAQSTKEDCVFCLMDLSFVVVQNFFVFELLGTETAEKFKHYLVVMMDRFNVAH